MHQVKIIRVEESFRFGTFGVVLIDTTAFCVSLEPRDEENASNISSIPAQQYLCSIVDSPKYGLVYEILNVPGRTHCLWHAGNVVENTEGCVIVARKFGLLGERRAVLNSGDTLVQFMKIMNGEDFHLTIVEHFG